MKDKIVFILGSTVVFIVLLLTSGMTVGTVAFLLLAVLLPVNWKGVEAGLEEAPLHGRRNPV